jgi:hypothetical protein
MTDVTLTWHQLASRDPELAQLLERDVRAAAALAPEPGVGLVCRVLASRPQTLSLQLNLPGWTKVLCVPLPLQPGSVSRVVSAALAARLAAPAPSLDRGAPAPGTPDADAALLETT